MTTENHDSPGVGAICARCGSMYCPTPGLCPNSVVAVADHEARRRCRDLETALAETTASFAQRLNALERPPRPSEEDLTRAVIHAARVYVRGLQTGASAMDRKRRLRSAVRKLDASQKAKP